MFLVMHFQMLYLIQSSSCVYDTFWLPVDSDTFWWQHCTVTSWQYPIHDQHISPTTRPTLTKQHFCYFCITESSHILWLQNHYMHRYKEMKWSEDSRRQTDRKSWEVCARAYFVNEWAVNHQLPVISPSIYSNLPPHRLNPKINATCMLIWNLNASEELVNGTELIRRGFHEHCRVGEVIGSRKLFLHPGFNYFHQIPPLPLNFAEDKI